MPFDLKKFIQSLTRKVNAVEEIKPTQDTPVFEEIVEKEEPKQDISIPVYEPALDEDYDILPPVKKRAKNSNISRKVSLNPLSDE